jgi:aminopeptidase N
LSNNRFFCSQVELDFVLNEDFTVVKSKLAVTRAPGGEGKDLALDGEDLDLKSICIDGKPLTSADFTVSGSVLTIAAAHLKEECEISSVVHIKPQNNLQLSGLYKSSGMFCTQCEAEGFRRITYIPDRPDVMSSYTVRVEADKTKYPVLLSNGNSTFGPAGKWELREVPEPSTLAISLLGLIVLAASRFKKRS